MAGPAGAMDVRPCRTSQRALSAKVKLPSHTGLAHRRRKTKNDEKQRAPRTAMAEEARAQANL
eukprot:CAMPEP_0176022260 /NCGR_PEP_ID=MMETSP0120_2-20121206/10831_1 /TAXON_ID=160619 /ORGANISM="Kryptoperidinium foliaceum, Strain CCMP 1326" /LENGTH=62 /DNA_ID=CAMNT_0017355395 /DNA_START=35 /DNA_END=224 /DNA_ORIENTATION=-